MAIAVEEGGADRRERIRFTPNQDKILEALVLLANEEPDIDIFHSMKVLFFADKEHLNRYGRPVLGDDYVAMDDGPVPSIAYDIAKRDPGFRINAELLERATEALDYLSRDSGGDYPRLRARREPRLNLFSRTDIECLRDSLSQYGTMPFQELWDRVHNEPSYKSAYVRDQAPQTILYEAMLNRDDPNYEESVREIRESCREAVL